MSEITSKDRRPNWDMWRLMPSATLQELIALSMDIDPKKVQFDHDAWMRGVDSPAYDEADEFVNRAEIVRRNTSSFDVVSLSMIHVDESKYTVRSFVRWILTTPLKVPPELESLLGHSRSGDIQGRMAEQETTPVDPIATLAEQMERALADLEARKTAAAERGAENSQHAERLQALQVKLGALPYDERRAVLDALGLHRVSAAPEPIKPVRGTVFRARPSQTALAAAQDTRTAPAPPEWVTDEANEHDPQPARTGAAAKQTLLSENDVSRSVVASKSELLDALLTTVLPGHNAHEVRRRISKKLRDTRRQPISDLFFMRGGSGGKPQPMLYVALFAVWLIDNAPIPASAIASRLKKQWPELADFVEERFPQSGGREGESLN